MKIQIIAATALCTLGAVAAPSWSWTDDSGVDKYFKNDGKDIYYCRSGWQSIRNDDEKYAFIIEKHHQKRDHGKDDGPNHDKGDDHGGHGNDDGKNHDKHDDHGHDGKVKRDPKHGQDDGPSHDRHDDHGHDGKLKREAKHGNDDGPNHDHGDDHGHGHDGKRDLFERQCRRLGAACERNGQCCSGECHRDRCRRDDRVKREAKHGSDDGPNHDRHDDHGDDGPNHDKHDDHGHDGKRDLFERQCRRLGAACERNGQCCSGECHRDRCRRDD